MQLVIMPNNNKARYATSNSVPLLMVAKLDVARTLIQQHPYAIAACSGEKYQYTGLLSVN